MYLYFKECNEKLESNMNAVGTIRRLARREIEKLGEYQMKVQ